MEVWFGLLGSYRHIEVVKCQFHWWRKPDTQRKPQPQRITASNWHNFHAYGPSPVPNLDGKGMNPGDRRRNETKPLPHWATKVPCHAAVSMEDLPRKDMDVCFRSASASEILSTSIYGLWLLGESTTQTCTSAWECYRGIPIVTRYPHSNVNFENKGKALKSSLGCTGIFMKTLWKFNL